LESVAGQISRVDAGSLQEILCYAWTHVKRFWMGYWNCTSSLSENPLVPYRTEVAKESLIMKIIPLFTNYSNNQTENQMEYNKSNCLKVNFKRKTFFPTDFHW